MSRRKGKSKIRADGKSSNSPPYYRLITTHCPRFWPVKVSGSFTTTPSVFIHKTKMTKL